MRFGLEVLLAFLRDRILIYNHIKMKNLLKIIFIFSFTLTFSQNLTVKDLLNLNSTSIEDGELFLLNKSWEYSKGENDNGIEIISYDYKPIKNSERKAMLHIFYNADIGNSLFVQFFEVEKYNEYINSVKKYSPELVSSGIDDTGRLKKVYRGLTTTFTFLNSKLKNNNGKLITSYTLYIKKNKD